MEWRDADEVGWMVSRPSYYLLPYSFLLVTHVNMLVTFR